ncbi:hypothetical protein QBC34DRAFT_478642 [Podospora aff. communis PSN243]|uniref:F-box domain-containing protein n=1 Tax=Podospora aff. communis PSN243 TaxID=3040156 RepID=A0AAV9G4E4_9PEZI|nr:hypothetical protein QBC34DRAFT_478642 [Podospora aff. communis PSN243]
MLSIVNLPAELVLEICSHIRQGQRPGNGCGAGDLSRHSRTCSFLRAVVQPAVFTSFVYRNSSQNRMTLLHRALDLRPDLCDNFRHFKVEFTINLWGRPDTLNDDDTRRVESQLAELGLPALDSRHDQHPRWYGRNKQHCKACGQCQRCPVDLLLVEIIVLRIAPHLTFLSLPFDTRWRMPTLRRHRTLNSSSTFPNLELLEITKLYNGGAGHLDVLEKTSLFGPSVTELWTYGIATTPLLGIAITSLFGLNVHEITRRSTALAGIRRLEFQGSCRMSVRDVHVMLASMPALQVLGLSWTRNGHGQEGEMWDAIAQRKTTLQELRIDNPSVSHFPPLHETDMRGLHSLEEFSQLEVLKIGPGMLCALWSACTREYPKRNKDEFLEGMFPRGGYQGTYPLGTARSVQAGHPSIGWGGGDGSLPALGKGCDCASGDCDIKFFLERRR